MFLSISVDFVFGDLIDQDLLEDVPDSVPLDLPLDLSQDLIGTHSDPVGIPPKDSCDPNQVLVPLNLTLSELKYIYINY